MTRPDGRTLYRRCYCGRPVWRPAEPFCAEHDDPPGWNTSGVPDAVVGGGPEGPAPGRSPQVVELTAAEQAVWDAVEADRIAGVVRVWEWREGEDNYVGQAAMEYGEVWGE